MTEQGVVAVEELTAFLARVTELQLQASGEGAERVADSVRRAARACGGTAELLLLPEAATLTVTLGEQSRTVIVRAFPGVSRLDRLTAGKPLLLDLEAGRIGLAEAARRLDAIAASPPPYPWWLRLLGITLFAIGFAPLMQGIWYEIGSTVVLGAMTASLAVLADRVPRLAKVLPLVAACAVSVVTMAVFARTSEHGGPVLLMLPALFFFVPGDYLSAATAELAAGQLTTGAIRLVYAVFLLVQLYVGVLIGVVVAGASTRSLFDVAAHADLPRWALFLSWIVFTAGTVLAFDIPRRLFWPLLALVYLTVAVQTGVTKLVGEVTGTFVAAIALTALAGLLARSPRRPPLLVLMLPGFFTLTVGSLGLRGLTTLAGGHVIAGFEDLLKLVTIVTAISVGMLLGAVLVEPRQGQRN